LRNSIKFLVGIIILIFISKILVAYPQQELTAESPTELKEILYQIVEADKIEFIIEVEGEFHYEIFGLSTPTRLAIDLSPIQKISVGPYVDIGIIGVLRIRVGEFQPQVARVVFDLGKRIPNYSIIPIERGVKVVFWFEEVIRKEEEKPLEVEEVEIEPEKIPEEIPEVITEEIIPKIPKILEHNYFIQGKFGLGLPFKPTVEAQSSFTLYGEQGNLNETYKLKTNLIFDLNVGKFFIIKDIIVKGNLSLSYLSFKNEGNFQVSLPHPIIPNSPRDYTFGDSLKGSLFNISVSPLFSILEKRKFEIWVGPIIGFSFGKLNILEDIDLEEKSPFTSSDITVTAKAYHEEKISSLLAGVLGNFEYHLSRNLSLVLDAKFFYLSPKSKTLDTRINFSQLQFALGLQYYFF